MVVSKIKERCKKMLKTLALGAMVLQNSSCQENTPVVQDVQKPKTEVKKDTVAVAVEDVAYRTDTLERATSTLMFYSAGGITRNYVEKNNSFRMRLPYFAHENWHHHNDRLGFRSSYPLTPEEYYKLCMHDEITANIAAILTARYEYLASDNKEAVIKKYENSYMGFYFKAVKEGKIKPESVAKKDRDAEWSLIANGTREMWMKKYYRAYAPRFTKKVKNFVGIRGLPEHTHKNYNYLRRQMYLCGGVDFWSYMKEDVTYKDNVVALTDYMRKSENLRKTKDMMPHIEKYYPLLKELEFDKQQESVQHLFISGMLREKLKGVDAENLKTHPQIVTSCYQKIFQDLQTDKGFEKVVEAFPEFSESAIFAMKNDEKHQEVLQKMYTVQGVNLMELIDGFTVEKVPAQIVTPNGDVTRISFWKNDMILPVLEDHMLKEMRMNSVSEGSKNNGTPAAKSRKSDVQHILLPNFNEAILVAGTSQQQEQIFQVMRDFEKIPDVLKGCDTQAQKKYWQEMEKNNQKQEKTLKNKKGRERER